MSVEKKNGDQCCSLQKRSTYGKKVGRKKGNEGDWMKSFSVTFSTILLQSVIGRHIDTSVYSCNRKCVWCGFQFRCELGYRWSCIPTAAANASVVASAPAEREVRCLRASISGSDLDIHFIARMYIHEKCEIFCVSCLSATAVFRFSLFKFFPRSFKLVSFSFRLFCKS